MAVLVLVKKGERFAAGAAVDQKKLTQRIFRLK